LKNVRFTPCDLVFWKYREKSGGAEPNRALRHFCLGAGSGEMGKALPSFARPVRV
jgi:hypothetical protein